jgi:predicted nuclease of predicted toxin-antitoxin system
MIRLLADESINGRLIRGLKLRDPGLDLLRVHDLGLEGEDDPSVLERAARDGRVVLTHDTATMVRFAYDRIASGEPMPGLLVVAQSVPLATAIDEILLAVGASEDGEWEGQVVYLPL